MTSFKELEALFPGENKEKVLLEFKKKQIRIDFEDGYVARMLDPVQVQDVEVPEGMGPAFMAAVRAEEPTAAKGTYFPRLFLERILKELL